MSIKVLCVYSLLANAALAAAVVWQDEVRATAVAEEQAIARDQAVLLHAHVARELASEDPARIADIEQMCERKLAELKPQVATIWDGRVAAR